MTVKKLGLDQDITKYKQKTRKANGNHNMFKVTIFGNPVKRFSTHEDQDPFMGQDVYGKTLELKIPTGATHISDLDYLAQLRDRGVGPDNQEAHFGAVFNFKNDVQYLRLNSCQRNQKKYSL